MQYGSQQLASPGLAVQILRASKDLVITPQEFSEIIGIMTNIVSGVMVMGMVGVIFRSVASSFLPESKELPQTQVGTCYEDAWRFLIKTEEGELVHGSVESQGRRTGHAWVEFPTGFVWEPQTGSFMRLDTFKTAFKPREEAKYSPIQAAIIAARTGNFGPWMEEERRKWVRKTGPESQYFTDTEEVLASAYIQELKTGAWKKQLNRMTDEKFMVEVFWVPWYLEAERPERWEKWFDTENEATVFYKELGNMKQVRKMM